MSIKQGLTGQQLLSQQLTNQGWLFVLIDTHTDALTDLQLQTQTAQQLQTY